MKGPKVKMPQPRVGKAIKVGKGLPKNRPPKVKLPKSASTKKVKSY